MSKTKAEIFADIKAFRGGLGYTQAEVDALDQILDRRAQKVHLHTLQNPSAFFTGVRKVTGPLNTIQVEVINLLIKNAAHWRTSWMAYGLATGWHEARLQPIKEKGGPKYLSKYDTGRLAAILGNTPEADGDGIKYAGRGLPQLTGLTNYKKASQRFGVDFVKYPDLVLEPEHAVNVMIWGMEDGAFTGKDLADYLPSRLGTVQHFTNARRIVNGTDKASLIAGYAVKFQDALENGGWR